MPKFQICFMPNLDATISYDINTLSQAFIFFIYGALCLIYELIFIFTTIIFFIHNANSLRRIYFTIFHISFHLSLLYTILYFFGGFICYDLIIYNMFANFSYLFQGIGVYSIIMEMISSLAHLSQIDGNQTKFNTIWCSPFILGYIIGFVYIFYKEYYGGELHYFFIYNVICHIIFIGSFFIISKMLYDEMSQKYPSFISNTNKNIWSAVIYIIMLLMGLRAIFAMLTFSGFTYYLKENYLCFYIIYIITLDRKSVV